MATSNLGLGNQYTDVGLSGTWNPNDPKMQAAAGELGTALQQMVSSGNLSGAQTLYNQKKQAFGFSDGDFAKYSGGFTPQQLSGLSANANPATSAVTTAGTAAQTGPAAQASSQGYTAQMAGPAAQASAMGYEATKANLGNAFSSMGLSDPTKANSQLLSGQVNNQYLDAQADNIQKRLTRNLNENIMPGIGQGATMAGGYGGSRMGIAQGKAIADTQDNLAGQLANLYGTANENAQNRMAGAAQNLSGLGAQTELANAGFDNNAKQFSANAQNQASLQNAQMQNANSMFNVGQGNTAAQFGANAGNTANIFNAGQNNANSQFNAGQQNQNSQFNAGQTNSYNLGLGGLQLQQESIKNQYTLGSQANQNAANANNNAYTLGQGQLANAVNQTANQATANQNNYNLGLGNQALGYANLDSNNQQFGANFGLNAANSAALWANQGVNAANGIQQTPINYFNNFLGNTNAIAGQGGTTSQTNQGNPYVSALGGIQLASNLYK